MPSLLARNRINLLSVNQLRGDTYAACYEYCYYNKDKSKVWAKDAYLFECHDITNEENINKIKNELVEYVAKSRAELEK